MLGIASGSGALSARGSRWREMHASALFFWACIWVVRMTDVEKGMPSPVAGCFRSQPNPIKFHFVPTIWKCHEMPIHGL